MPAGKVYLAGPITGLSYDAATDWRATATNGLSTWGIEAYSPLRAKSYLQGTAEIADSYETKVLSSRRGITTRDRWDVQRCDVIFVNLIGAKRVSIGTVVELGWADAARKPIVLCMEPGNVHDHAMVNEMAGFTVTTVESGIEIVKALLAS